MSVVRRPGFCAAWHAAAANRSHQSQLYVSKPAAPVQPGPDFAAAAGAGAVGTPFTLERLGVASGRDEMRPSCDPRHFGSFLIDDVRKRLGTPFEPGIHPVHDVPCLAGGGTKVH